MKDRPETLRSKTNMIDTAYGKLYVTVTEHEEKPVEIFCIIGKSGKSTTAKAEVIGRLASLALQYGASIEEIIDQTKGISGEVLAGNPPILSIPDAVAKVLTKLYKRKE